MQPTLLCRWVRHFSLRKRNTNEIIFLDREDFDFQWEKQEDRISLYRRNENLQSAESSRKHKPTLKVCFPSFGGRVKLNSFISCYMLVSWPEVKYIDTLCTSPHPSLQQLYPTQWTSSIFCFQNPFQGDFSKYFQELGELIGKKNIGPTSTEFRSDILEFYCYFSTALLTNKLSATYSSYPDKAFDPVWVKTPPFKEYK